MRYIFMMVMLATILFAQQQRQIILGSFSIESNALFYSLDVHKQISKDTELKKLIDKYSLVVEYKKVGAYNVVSICPFDDYPSLFQTIAVVKKNYPTAYAIKFPAFASSIKAPPVVEQEAAEEVKAQELKPAEPEVKYEPQKTPKPVPLPISQADSLSESLSMDDLFLLIGLLLIIIGFVLYKIKMKKNEEEEE